MSQGNDWIMSREYALVDPYTLVFYGWGVCAGEAPEGSEKCRERGERAKLVLAYSCRRCEIKRWGASSLPNGKSKDLRLGRPLFPKRGNPRNQLF